MKNKYYQSRGLPLLRLPITGNNKVNNMMRNVQDLGTVTAAFLYHECGIMNCRGVLYCGKLNKALPVYRYFVRAFNGPVVLLVSNEYTYERSGLQLVFDDYCIDAPCQSLSNGNGTVFVGDDEAALDVIDMITANQDRAFVYCAADGLQVSDGILNALSRARNYLILTEMLTAAAGNGLEADDLVGRAKVLLFYPVADAGRYLIPVLPKYAYEKPVNSLMFGYHNHQGGAFSTGAFHKNSGLGLNISQSREYSVEPVINEAQLADIHEKGQLVIYNALSQDVYVGKISQ